MAELDKLYREIIMEHYKNPRNKGLKEAAGYKQFRIKNPSCGDDITMQSLVKDGKVLDVRHMGHGCSISMASASIVSELIIGKTVEESKKLINNYLNMLTDKGYDQTIDLEEALVFSGVKDYPARVKCASIAWLALKNTLE